MNYSMDVRGYKLLYNEQVWNPIEFTMEFDVSCEGGGVTIDEPVFLSVTVLDSNGNVMVLHDESLRFQFVQSWECPLCGADVEWRLPYCSSCGADRPAQY